MQQGLLQNGGSEGPALGPHMSLLLLPAIV